MSGGAPSPNDEPRRLQVFSPSQAQARRAELIQQRNNARAQLRAASNQRRKQHIAEGKRLPRDRPPEGRISFVTVNATAATSLMNELKHGSQLKRAGVLMVQEHALVGEELDRHQSQLQDLGWNVLAEPAYRKAEGLGGGTAILTAGTIGIRAVQSAEREHVGRITLGIVNIGREVLAVSLYCISSAPMAKQLKLWQYVANWVRWLGIPFIVGADAQVRPEDLVATGICELLQARVCAPEGPTTTASRHPID